MARVPEVIRRQAVSQVAAQPVQAGAGWAALSELAKVGADFVKPAAEKQAREEGYDAVYRDESGKLQVAERSVLGGEFSDIHNAAAFSKYLAQRNIDMSETFTELARNNEFNPGGFKAAADGYVKMLEEDENIPRALKEDLLASAKQEASRRFNGLQNNATQREYRESDRNTATHRDMLVDDYVNLYAAGQEDEAEAKLAEIEGLSSFRANAPYISETPAETEAYLRGARGAARAARLSQILTDTEGALEISDELRTEIDTALNDPDLSPQARQKLYAAVAGRLKGVDAAAFVNTATNDSYSAKLRRAESGGQLDAANPNSSALGPHQFLKGTWTKIVSDLRDKGGAAWAEGLSKDEILAMRTNADASDEVFAEFRAQNAGALQNAGIPINDANEYLAHFLGVGGAIDVLTADVSTSVEDILSPKVIEANPFLANMTVADIRNWSARKMTMKASDIAMQQNAVDQIGDTEVRAMASSLLNDRYGIRKRLEDAAALEYETRLTSNDDTLTEREIREDHSLSDKSQNALINELRRNRKDQIEVQQTVAQLAGGFGDWDPYDSGQRNRVDKAYSAVIGDDSPSSPAGMAASAEIAMETGFVPKSSFNAIRGALSGDDPEAFAANAEFLGQVLQRQGGAIDMYGGKAEVEAALSDYGFYSRFMGPQEAAARVIENSTPEAKARRKNLSAAAKDATKALNADDLTEHLKDRGISASLGNEVQQAEIMTEYESLFVDAYLETGEATLAKNRALDAMSRIYGPNAVTGTETLMKYPPQNFYPASETSPDWMQTQLVDQVSELAFADGVENPTRPGESVRRRKIDAEDIILLPDEITRREVAGRSSPSYAVLYKLDGEIVAAPGRFYFDPTAINSEAKALSTQRAEEFETQRSRETQATNLRLWREHLRTQGMSEGQALREVTQNKEKYGAEPPEGN